MPLVLTSGATLLCPHGGRVVIRPSQQRVTVDGQPVVCRPSLEGAPIAGCLQPPTPSTKPCTLLVATNPGSTSEVVSVDGMAAYLSTLTGMTDGVPPGIVSVADAGQRTVQAAIVPGAA